jgi:hypothetical protein
VSVARDVLSQPRRTFSRRRFFALAGTAGAAAVVAAGAEASLFKVAPVYAAPAFAANGHEVEALLLNCMDFRLVNEVTFLMNEHGLTNRYDQVIMAGATLGIATDKYPSWAQTFWDHLDLAIKLHGVKRVIAIDHRDCGAYKLALGKDYGQLPLEETEIHSKVMQDFRDQVMRKQPAVDVELLLMGLDGKVEPIGA